MKSSILIFIFALTTAFTQNSNYTSLPPLSRTLNEIIKIEKIDTSKAKYSNGKMLVYTRIDGDSAQIMYQFDLQNKLSSKTYLVYLSGHTGKAALKKFRTHNSKITANFGRAVNFEGMTNLPTNDQDKLWYLSKGEALMSSYETDTFYILSSLYAEESSGIYTILTTYVSPEEWNKIHNE